MELIQGLKECWPGPPRGVRADTAEGPKRTLLSLVSHSQGFKFNWRESTGSGCVLEFLADEAEVGWSTRS